MQFPEFLSPSSFGPRTCKTRLSPVVRVALCCLPTTCLGFPTVHWVWVGKAHQKQVLVKLPQCTRASGCTIQTGRRKAGCCCWGKGINQQEMTTQVQPFINYRRARADSGSSSHTALWGFFLQTFSSPWRHQEIVGTASNHSPVEQSCVTQHKPFPWGGAAGLPGK